MHRMRALSGTGGCGFECAVSATPWQHPCPQIDLVKGMMDCLYAECTPCITDCVMAELEKLGQKYRVALKVAKASEDKPWRSWCHKFWRLCRSAGFASARMHDAP